MRVLRTLLLAAVCCLPAGCDSGGNGDTLTAAFFVGNWTLVGVSDSNGDRTAEVEAVLDDLSLDFESDGDFAMAVDYSAAVNAGGTPDTTFAGTYGVSGGGNLVLTIGDVGISLGVDTEGTSRAVLRAPAVVVNELLSGSAVDLGLVGTAALTIQRD
jgi:hypothetical protein